MRLPAIVALVSAFTAVPSGAPAAESSEVPTLAVPQAKAADPLVAHTVAVAVTAEAQRFPVRPVAAPDALAGCTEAACLKGLAADFLLVSEVSQTADQWVLAVDLLLVKQAKSLMTASRKAPLSAPIAELAADAAAEVLMAIGEPTAPRAPKAAPAPVPEAPAPSTAPEAAPTQPTAAADATAAQPPEKASEPAPSPAPEPPAEPAAAAPSQQAATEPAASPAPAAAVQAAAKPVLSDSDRRLGGYVLDGVGGALLVGGAISGVVALTSWDSAKAAKTVPDYQSARDRGQVATAMADALYGIGGAVLAVGLIMTFFPASQPAPAPASAPGAPSSPPAPAPVSVAPALLPGGGGIVFAGGF